VSDPTPDADPRVPFPLRAAAADYRLARLIDAARAGAPIGVESLEEIRGSLRLLAGEMADQLALLRVMHENVMLSLRAHEELDPRAFERARLALGLGLGDRPLGLDSPDPTHDDEDDRDG
jgi:hypothetical protein